VNGRRERGRCPLLLATLAVLAALLLLAALLPWWSQWRADLERAAVTEAPEAPAELPATGPAVPVALGLSSLLSLGFYLHRKLV